MHRLRLGAIFGGGLSIAAVLFGASSFAASPPSTAQLTALHPAMQQILARGSRNHWVMTLQADLGLLGYTEVGPVDGIFGPKTQAALEAFQTRHGFSPTGITSPAVWQDILAGFGITPPYAGTTITTPHPTQSSVSAPQGTSSSEGTPSSLPNTSVLPATFPKGGTPVAEPGLPSAGSGIMGQFTPSVKTIDGRPVLKAYHMVATSYGPSLQDNYPYGPTDAFGNPLQNGMVAVDPSVIPLHSVVYVKGYQDNYLPQGGFLGQAMDTGGAIKGDRVDLFINANPTVISDFGVQQVTVYVLGK